MLQVRVTGLTTSNVMIQDPHPADGAWRLEVRKDQSKTQHLTTGQLSRMQPTLESFQEKGLIKFEVLGDKAYVASVIPVPSSVLDAAPSEDVLAQVKAAAVAAVADVIEAFKEEFKMSEGVSEENMRVLTSTAEDVAGLQAKVEDIFAAKAEPELDTEYKVKKGENAWGDKPPKTYREAIHRLAKMFE